MNFDEMEKRLRTAPQPEPPAGLKQKLTAQIHLPLANVTPVLKTSGGVIGWLRRWWPALAPAGVSLACAAVMVAQQMKAGELRRSNQALEQQIVDSRASAAATPAGRRTEDEANAVAQAAAAEIARLKERAAQLGNSVARLERLEAENKSLRIQSTAESAFSEEELAGIAKLQEEAVTISCANNLRQIGLAARLWLMNNKDVYPPNFFSMSNELNTPKILICPADTNRAAARVFGEYTDANTSYELLAPSGSDLEPQRVLTRCPIHGTVGLCDGSVHRGADNRLVERDGKLYLNPAAGR
jgi:hypothetical protein